MSPLKVFEYMSAGIPVIASNFSMWKQIIEKHQCGICVDPENSEQIAEAITTIISDDLNAEKMGNRGHEAVKKLFNWETEFEKLKELYKSLI